MFMSIEKSNLKAWIQSVEGAKAGSKNPKLISYIIKLASKPKRSRPSVNLSKLDRLAKENESIIVPGKVLGSGTISKKINIAAVDFSDGARSKLNSAKCNIVKIEELLANKSSRIII